MKTTYDQQADALYIQLTSNKVVSTKRVSDQVIVDFDENGEVIGVEVLHVRATGIDPVMEAAISRSESGTPRPDPQIMQAGREARMLALKRQREDEKSGAS